MMDSNQGQDLLGEGDHDTACDGQHTVGTLRGVMRFQRQTELKHTEAKQDDTYGTDQSEDEIAEVIDHLYGVVICKCYGRNREHEYDRAEDAEQHAGSFG